ncbi:MAG: cytochrome c [Rhodocyclales bacterium]|nr:cytochrome c [Rhodocyclales bacterium]
MRTLLLLSSLVLAAAAQAAGDPKLGKALHDKQCAACHVRLVGGDGSKLYTRTPRLIKDRAALAQRVTMCVAQTGTKWFPEEEEHVTAYLAQQFYKFK